MNAAPPQPSLDDLLAATAAAFDLTEADLRSRSRKAPIVRARQAFCYLALTATDNSCTRVGRTIGRHHTTVMYAVDMVDIHEEHTPYFRDRFRPLKSRFLGDDQ